MDGPNVRRSGNVGVVEDDIHEDGDPYQRCHNHGEHPAMKRLLQGIVDDSLGRAFAGVYPPQDRLSQPHSQSVREERENCEAKGIQLRRFRYRLTITLYVRNIK